MRIGASGVVVGPGIDPGGISPDLPLSCSALAGLSRLLLLL